MYPLFRTPNRVLSMLVGWTLFSTGVATLVSGISGIALGPSLILFVPAYFLWLLFLIPNYYLCRSLPLDRGAWTTVIGTQTLIVLVTALIWALLSRGYALILDSLSESTPWMDVYSEGLFTNLAIFASQYEFFVLLHYLLIALQRGRDLEQAALQQELLTSKAELRALRATIHPHFLFNALNALANITDSEPSQARHFCLRLADFLRYSVAYGDRPTATLGAELEHVQNYLSIERERFGERLRTEIQADEDMLDTPVPSLMLFPLVENAIKHGIDSCIEGGCLELKAGAKPGCSDGLLLIEISNPVDELGHQRQGTGIGLISLRQRLKNRYGDEATLQTNREGDRFIARICLPLRRKKAAGS